MYDNRGWDIAFCRLNDLKVRDTGIWNLYQFSEKEEELLIAYAKRVRKKIE